MAVALLAVLAMVSLATAFSLSLCDSYGEMLPDVVPGVHGQDLCATSGLLGVRSDKCWLLDLVAKGLAQTATILADPVSGSACIEAQQSAANLTNMGGCACAAA